MELDEALSFAKITMTNFNHVEKYDPEQYKSLEDLDIMLHTLYSYVMKAEKEKKLNSALKGGKDGK